MKELALFPRDCLDFLNRYATGVRFLGGVGLLVLTAGCATTTSGEPEWPEQPSPSYPDASNQQSGAKSAATLDEPAQQKTESASPGSTLAKKYDGKKALSTLRGKATYYADSLAGNHTASGDVYDPNEYTAAHKKLPFGTILRVVREDNGAETYVRVNDRGPFGPKDRIVDLSKAAAQELDMMRAGVVGVRVEVVARP
jgi:rare lipoprotein A